MVTASALFETYSMQKQPGLAYKWVVCEALFMKAGTRVPSSQEILPRNTYRVLYDGQDILVEEDEFEKYATCVRGNRTIPETAIIIPLMKGHAYVDRIEDKKKRAASHGYFVQLTRADTPVFYSEAAFHATFKSDREPLSAEGHFMKHHFLSPESVSCPIAFVEIDKDTEVTIDEVSYQLKAGDILVRYSILTQDKKGYETKFSFASGDYFRRNHEIRRRYGMPNRRQLKPE